MTLTNFSEKANNLEITQIDPTELNQYDYVVLMDLSWQLHKNFYVFKNFHAMTPAGIKIPNGHLFGTLQVIKSFLSMNNRGRVAVVIVKDGFPKERVELSTSKGIIYKEGRGELEYNFFNDIPYVVKLGSIHPDVFFSYNKDKEADDNIYSLSRKINNTSIFINSGDNDLMQSLTSDNRVSVVRKISKGNPEIIDWDTFTSLPETSSTYKKFLNIAPSKLPFYRAIVGDSSDSLKGVTRFPHKIAKEISERAEVLGDLFKEDIYESKYSSRLIENKDTIIFNYQMMKLKDNYEPNLYKVSVSSDYATKVILYFSLYQWGKFLKGSNNL